MAHSIGGDELFENSDPVFKQLLEKTFFEMETTSSLSGNLEKQISQLMDKSEQAYAVEDYQTAYARAYDAWNLLGSNKYEIFDSYYVVVTLARNALLLNDISLMVYSLEHLLLTYAKYDTDGEREYLVGQICYELDLHEQSLQFFSESAIYNGGMLLIMGAEKYYEFFYDEDSSQGPLS